jgi:hypothetical protein
MCFVWIRGAIINNYIQSQKALSKELMAYTKIFPAPIIDGLVYEVKTSFFSFNAPRSTDPTTTEKRKYFYKFTIEGKVYNGVTTLRNHYSTREMPDDLFWLPDKGEKVQIIFNPSDYTRNMPLAWAKRLTGWKDSSRFFAFGGLITVSGGLIYIIWHYLKLVRQKQEGRIVKNERKS